MTVPGLRLCLLLFVALEFSSTAHAHGTLSHKRLSKEAKIKVKQLRKITNQIEEISVDAGDAKKIRWDDVCENNAPLKETNLCEQLTPQAWFDAFYPNTNQFLASQEDSEENANGFQTMCVENEGPCSSLVQKTPHANMLRSLLQMKPEHACRQCIQRSYNAAIDSMHTHITVTLADTVQSLHAFSAHTNSSAFTSLATQRAERITQHVLPVLTTDRLAHLYAYHVARMAPSQVMWTKPEEIATVTACCADAVTLPSIVTTWFTTTVAYMLVAISVFGGLWAWQSSYQVTSKARSGTVKEASRGVSVTEGASTTEESRQAAARSIQTVWKKTPTSKASKVEGATRAVVLEPRSMVAEPLDHAPAGPAVFPASEPIATSWRRGAPLPTSVSPGKDPLLTNTTERPVDVLAPADKVIIRQQSQDDSQTTDDSIPDLVPQQLSPRLLAEKKQSRGWMILALIALFIAIGMGLYLPEMENDGYSAVPVPRTPPKKVWSDASNLGGSYGPMMPFRTKK